jgi:excisionase family DNA binding protein
MSEDRLLTAKEVADILQVKESWVRDKTREGVLPCVPLPGRFRRYSLPEVQAWIDGLKRNAA